MDIHATFLIKLGNTTIITDPVFEKNMGPLFFGPKRFVDPAISLKEIPEVNLFLLTHNHYDHLDRKTASVLVEQQVANPPFCLVLLGLKKWFGGKSIELVIGS